MIETVGRVQNAPTARRDEMTEGPVQIEFERTGMEQNDATIGKSRPTVVVNLDFGFQLYVWSPEMTGESLVEWFRGLSEGDMKNLWDDPRTLPGKVEQIALARSVAPTHVLSIEGKKRILLVEVREGSPVGGTLMVRNLYDDE